MFIVGDDGETYTQPLPTSEGSGCSPGSLPAHPNFGGSASIATTANGKPCLCGGKHFNSDCFVFTPDTREWTKMASLLEGRRSAFTIQVNENDFIVMGECFSEL